MSQLFIKSFVSHNPQFHSYNLKKIIHSWVLFKLTVYITGQIRGKNNHWDVIHLLQSTNYSTKPQHMRTTWSAHENQQYKHRLLLLIFNTLQRPQDAKRDVRIKTLGQCKSCLYVYDQENLPTRFSQKSRQILTACSKMTSFPPPQNELLGNLHWPSFRKPMAPSAFVSSHQSLNRQSLGNPSP